MSSLGQSRLALVPSAGWTPKSMRGFPGVSNRAGQQRGSRRLGAQWTPGCVPHNAKNLRLWTRGFFLAYFFELRAARIGRLLEINIPECPLRLTKGIAQMNSVTVSFENPFIPSCQVADELDHLARAARRLVSLGDTPRRSAASVRAIAAVARKQHRHTSECSRCLIAEALAAAEKAVMHG